MKKFLSAFFGIVFGAIAFLILISSCAAGALAIGVVMALLFAIPSVLLIRNSKIINNSQINNNPYNNNMNTQNHSNPQYNNPVVPKIFLTPDDFTFDKALNVYFNTSHDSCESKYNYSSFFRSAFQCILNNLPKYPIILSNEKVLRKKAIDNPIVDYKNITKSTPTSKLSRFVAIDTETTGLSVGGNDIIEICAIKFIDFLPTEKFHTYLKPRNPIPTEATNINHITDEMVADAPKFSQIKSSLQQFIEGFPLVAHNAQFDIKFLHVSGLDLKSHEKMVYDTLALSRRCFRDLDSYKLTDLCIEQNIVTGNSHSAEEDTLACAILFTDIIRQKYEVTSVSEL